MTSRRAQDPTTELWDVTDAEGRPTGQVHRRGAPGWHEGRFHVIAAVCAVRDDGRVLLTRRAVGKEFALDWEFPGGSALSGETSVEAARRELREETGIDAAPERLTFIGRFVESSALLDLYVARVPGSVEVVPDPEEVADAAWVELDELSRRIDSGALAEPWLPRLAELWTPLVSEIGEAG